MKAKVIIFSAFSLLSTLVLADDYRFTYSWNAPSYLPTDTPMYGMRYRLAGGTPIVLTDTTTPAGAFDFATNPGTLLEVCPQNKNGQTLIVPDCTALADWIAVGSTSPSLTTPPVPGGFSGTLIRVGP